MPLWDRTTRDLRTIEGDIVRLAPQSDSSRGGWEKISFSYISQRGYEPQSKRFRDDVPGIVLFASPVSVEDVEVRR